MLMSGLVYYGINSIVLVRLSNYSEKVLVDIL